MRLIFILALLITLPVLTVQAEAPIPSSRKQALEDVERDLTQKKAEIRDLEAKASKLRKELQETQTDLVSKAEKIKDKEYELSQLENRIQNHTEEKNDIEARLKKDRGSMAAMVLAVERIRRVPPEALILKPGAPYETAQTALLLESVLPQIHTRSESFKKDAERLAVLLDELEADKKALISEQAALQQDYDTMSSLLDKRKYMVTQSQDDFEQRNAEVRAISQQASTLKELVRKLEEDKKRQETRASVKRAVYRQPENLPRAGNGQLPISGFIVTGFGQTDDIGAKSQGIRIEGRENGLVVAPMGGKVQFAGLFKNYGQLIILEHENGYHSLIAGLDRIDIVVEQVLNAGEPVGILPRIEDGDRPVLYYELRKDGKPVNPSTKIANLKS